MKKSILLLLAFSVLIITCENHVFDNPVDPGSDTYTGVESVDLDGDGVGFYEDVDEIVIAGPVDGTVITDTASPVLTIQLLNPEIVTFYRIQISTVSNFASDIVFDNSTITTNVFSVPAGTLANNTTYYWRAMAFDGVKWSDGWSEVGEFTVDIGTEVPLLSFPLDNHSIEDSTTIFNWETISSATKYHIQVNKETDFTGAIIVDDNTIVVSEYTLGTVLENSTNYYWRIKIMNSDGLWGDWSDVWSFHMLITFTEHTIVGNFDGVEGIYTIDVDGDGDMDVLGAATGANEIAWWENDGSSSFNKHTIIANFDHACCVYASDIDGDGDIDILGATHFGDEISWWENSWY